MMETLKSILYFQTLQIVTIHSLRIGAIHRIFQLAVLFYIFIYSIYYAKGYQEKSDVSGVLFTKVKGSAFYNGTGGYTEVYDSNDMVIPPTEANALFILTSYIETLQKRDICPSNVDVCRSNADCPANTLTALGKILPVCNITQGASSGFCLLETWCPLENDSIPDTLQGVENMTVFLRTSATYNKFNIQVADPSNAILGVNLFTVKDMIGGFIQPDCSAGCIVVADIDWTCNLDNMGCSPTHTFVKVPGGFNFRNVNYYFLPDDNGTLIEYRQLEKLYGLRFLFQITGTGGKFSFFQMIITIGSGIAFLSVATLLVDFSLLVFYSSDSSFLKSKYIDFKDDDIVDNTAEI